MGIGHVLSAAMWILLSEPHATCASVEQQSHLNPLRYNFWSTVTLSLEVWYAICGHDLSDAHKSMFSKRKGVQIFGWISRLPALSHLAVVFMGGIHNRGKWGSTWDQHFMASHLHQFTWAAQGELHLWHWDSHQIMEPQYSCSNQHQIMCHMIIVHPLAMWHLTIHHLLDQQPMLLLGLLLVEVIPTCLASKINLYLLIVSYLKWVPSASVLVFAA